MRGREGRRRKGRGIKTVIKGSGKERKERENKRKESAGNISRSIFDDKSIIFWISVTHFMLIVYGGR